MAPLIVYLAIATMQIAAVALSKVTLTTATQAAARDFATRGGSEIKSRQTADRLLKISGLPDCGKTFTFNRRKVSGVSLVQVKITQCVRLTSLNRTVHLVSSAESVDESKL